MNRNSLKPHDQPTTDPFFKALKQPSKNPKQKKASSPTASLTSGKKWLFRFIAMVALPLFLLAGLEVILRLIGYGYDPSLFKEMKIGGQEFLVNNDTFGLRFFPPQLERFTEPVRMEAKKSPDTCRIFILGESAAMGDPEPAYGASRYMEALLETRFPKTHFEIVNLGITAINSHVILPIARECARREGDLWIIYMGNNEMVGPFGAATVFGAKVPPLPLIRLNLAMQKFKLGQLLVNLGRKLKGNKGGATSWGGMEMFVGNQLPADDPRKAAVYQNFSKNLHDIVMAGLGSGAKVILNTVAVNLKDCAPFASLGNSNLNVGDQAQFEKFFHEGIEFEDQNAFSNAVERFDAAVKIDPHQAEARFRLGESYAALHKFGDARAQFQNACDDDALPFRADSHINKIIRAEKENNLAGNLRWLDAAENLSALTPEMICGNETFYEHVHFNFDGSYRLALAWAQEATHALPAWVTNQATGQWITQPQCERRLGLADWNRSLILQHMVGRLRQPPLNGQLHNDARIRQLEEKIARLQTNLNTNLAALEKKNFVATLERAPDDFVLRENFALFLQATGDIGQAVAEWQAVHDLLPQDYLAYYQLGRLLEKQGRLPEAESAGQKAVALHPYFTEGWLELGNVRAAENKFEPAMEDYRRAQAFRPKDPAIVLQMARVQARMKNHDDAVKFYRQAIELNPGDWEAHFELGGELDFHNDLAGAALEFGLAVKANPNYSRTHFNYGVLLAKQGHMAEAETEFEATVRLEPGYEKARDYLEKIKVMKTQRP